MKKYEIKCCFVASLVLTLFLIVPGQNVGIGTSTPQEKLHVAGCIRSDSCAGTSKRVVQADSLGNLKPIPNGNFGDVLTQTSSGPEFRPHLHRSSLDNCLPLDCPTMMTGFLGPMNLGNCIRTCEASTSSGFTDWRVPEVDEVLYLLPQLPPNGAYFWTKTHIDNSGYDVIRTSDADIAGASGSSLVQQCRCIR